MDTVGEVQDKPSKLNSAPDHGEKHERLLEEAEREWAAVESITPVLIAANRVPADPELTGDATRITKTPLLHYNEAWKHFQTLDIETLLKKSTPNGPTSQKALARVLERIFGPPKLKSELSYERDVIYCIAGLQFDNGNPVHSQMLQTIHKGLTGNQLDTRRYGTHWEDIGFQGSDPATDLRGVGLLGLFNLLAFITNSRTSALAREVYRLSTHQVQNFPFCVMGINLSRIVLCALREKKLNRLCNQQRSVVEVVCDFYAALYYKLYTMWRYERMSIADSGFVLKEVERCGRKRTKQLISELEAYLRSEKRTLLPACDTGDNDSRGVFGTPCFIEEGGEVTFSDINQMKEE